MRAALVLSLFLLLSTGCAQRSTTTTTYHPATVASAELATHHWTNSGRTFLLRHAGTLTIRGRELHIETMARVDTKAGTVRAVGLGEFGVKLFDIELADNATTVHMVANPMQRIPDFADSAVFCLERLFLRYRPLPTDEVIMEDSPLSVGTGISIGMGSNGRSGVGIVLRTEQNVPVQPTRTATDMTTVRQTTPKGPVEYLWNDDRLTHMRGAGWRLVFSGSHELDKTTFPKQVRLTNDSPEYAFILKLGSAQEIQ